MPLSLSAELAQRLLLITLEIEQSTQGARDLAGLVQARDEVLGELSKCNLDPKARQILERVQESEACAIANLQDWRGVIAEEAAQSNKRQVAVKAYAKAA